MATTGATGNTRVDTPRTNGVRRRIAERNHETKAAIKATEFWAMLGLIVAILVSAAVIKGGDTARTSSSPSRLGCMSRSWAGPTSSPAASRRRAATSPTPTTTR